MRGNGAAGEIDPARAELSHREVMTVIGALLLALFLAAVDATIVSTALPTMAGELGGLDQLPWVLTAYLLTSTASTPLWGKLSDLRGRRRMFQVAIVWYLVASAISGAAQSMPQLVVGRGLQGIGGGGIMALTFVIIGDLVSPRERGRYMGWFTGTFTFASLIGPLIGGFFVDNASWRWLFYLKIPFGLLALVAVSRVLRRLPFRRVQHRIDFEGAALLVAAVAALILVMVLGGDRMAWTSPTILGLSAFTVVSTAAFVWQERRAEEPIIPMRLFSDRILVLAYAATLCAGGAMMAAGSFIPLFLQVVAGESATASGLALAPMMVMLTLGSMLAGNLMTRLGRYKVFIVVGPVLLIIGMAALTRLDGSSTGMSMLPWLVLLGLGMGLFMPTTTTLTQNALPVADLGVGTATLTFCRNLGQTIGIGAYGAALAARMDAVLAERLPADTDLDVDELLSTPEDIRLLPPDLRDAVIDAVGQATTLVFTLALPVAVAILVAGILIPERPLRTWSAPPSPLPAKGGPVASGHADR